MASGNDSRGQPRTTLQGGLTALSLIDRHAQARPHHPAVLFDDRIVTYGELVERSWRLASVLREEGVRPSSRVCLISPNCPEYYVAYFAVLRCGGSLFPINTDLVGEEIAYIAKQSDPVLIIVGDGAQAAIDDACRSEMPTTPLVALTALVDRSASAPALADAPARQPGDVALVVHTSGTTALPKGVVATDDMEVRSALALRACWDLRPSDVSVCALPLSYTFGLFTASFVAFTSGATVLLFRKFHPVRVLQGIQRHRASLMVGVPTMYAMMLEHADQTAARYDLSSMRMMAASGAPAAPRIKEDFQRVFGVILRDYYALSECTPIFSFDLRDGAVAPPLSSSGSLVDGAQVRLLDDDDRPVAQGETGALQVRSERLMSGYYRDPERTKAAFVDGWFKTGDLAYEDAGGHFFVVGRERDQVISGGHKIASSEVESLLLKHEAIAQAAVVGSPHQILGEIVKAVIVLKDGCAADPAELATFCEQHLAPFKVPKLFEFRQALPISPAGKVLKRELI